MKRKTVLKEAVLFIVVILVGTALFVFTPITKMAKADTIQFDFINEKFTTWPPDGWTQEDNSEWQKPPPSDPDQHCTYLTYSNVIGDHAWLKTPMIDTRNSETLNFNFMHKYYGDNTTPEICELKIYIQNGSGIWHDITPWLDISPNPVVWTSVGYIIDSSPSSLYNAIGAGTQVMFEFSGNNLYCWQIDNVIIRGTVPAPQADFTFTPSNPTSTTNVHFTDISTVSGTTIVSRWWDFGDGYYSDLQNPVHCFYADGVYLVNLTITDNLGNRNTLITDITVQESTPTPVLCYSPSSHNFGDMTAGNIASTSFEIWNSGTGILTYSPSESTSWVSVTPTSESSTGEHDTITVNVDTTGLSPGSYNCPISISSNGGSGMFNVNVNIVPSAVLDQQQTKYTNKYSFYDVNWLGQSFIPTVKKLTHTEIYINKVGNPSSDVVISVRNSPTGPDLVIVSRPAAEILTTNNWVDFDFSDLTVTPGSPYYLVLRTYGGNCKNYYNWGFGSTTPYTNGIMWFSCTAGFLWVSCTKSDFCFKIYGV
jgi:PKD repeat protein